MKYGFIFETECNVGTDFIKTSQKDDILEKIMGIESPTMANIAINELTKDDIKTFDFCGSFTKPQLEALSKEYGADYTFNVMSYLPAEEEKLNNAEDLSNYGVIIKNPNLSETQEEKLICETCATSIAFIKDLEDAKIAANKMVKEGIHFIELCSYFDKEKTVEIIEAINGAVPVGTAGKL